MQILIQILMMILLGALPDGTAIICGAFTEWAGKTVSGWCSIGGLALGIYFFSKRWTFWARLVLRYITDPLRWHCTKWSCGDLSLRSFFKEGQVKRRDVCFWH